MGLELLASGFLACFFIYESLFKIFLKTWLLGPHNSISKEGYTDKPNAEWLETKLFLIYGYIVLMKQFRKLTHGYAAVTLASQLPGTGRWGLSIWSQWTITSQKPRKRGKPSSEVPNSGTFHLLQPSVQAGTWPRKAIPKEEVSR